MNVQGIHAALQDAGSAGTAAFALDGLELAGILLLTAAAAAGWALYLSARSGARQVPPPAGPPTGERRAAAGDPVPPTAPPGAPEGAPPASAGRPDALAAHYERSLEGHPDGAVLCRAGRIVRAACRAGLLGEAPGRLEGEALISIVAPEDLLPVAEELRRGPAAGEIHFAIHLPPAPARFVAARILAPDGAPPGDCVVLLSDRTEPAVMARAASTIARRVAAALERIPFAVLVTHGGSDGERVALANSTAGALLGADAGSLAGLPVTALRDRAEAAFGAGCAARLFPPPGVEGEEVIPLAGPGPAHLERLARPLDDAAPSAGRIFVIRDVTDAMARVDELRRAESEAREAWAGLEERQGQILMANEGLERRIADFARFNRELKVIDEMKSNFLANVSHELQTPLVAIKGYTEMILKGRLGPLTEEQERGLRVALRNVDRLIGLIDSLLSFVRTEKDSEPLRIESFPLKPLVDEVVELLADRAAARAIAIKVQLPAGDLTIRADRNRISQVFINIVGNAVKYNREGGSVEIEATRGSRSTARVEVRDTGRGIAREELERIFERFYRSSSAGEEGTGLGLAIARDILRLHGCQIRADSEPGKGSTFSFTLPLETKGKAQGLPGVEKDEG